MQVSAENRLLIASAVMTDAGVCGAQQPENSRQQVRVNRRQDGRGPGIGEHVSEAVALNQRASHPAVRPSAPPQMGRATRDKETE